jgi:AmmeMemoRadiSam system protein B
MNMSSHPKLRPLDIRPQQQNGRSYLLLRDPQQLTDKMLLVPQPLAMALAFCDGRHDARSIAANFGAQYGVNVPVSLIEELLDALDEALMLDNDRTAQAYTQALEAYRAAPFRTPTLAGTSYPAEASKLWRLLQDYLEGAETIEPLAVDWSHNVGVLSPHIDYPRGGPVYAQVWKRAAQAAQTADLVVIFGTDHYGSDPFTLTRQNYATPYGLLPTAQSIVDRLAEVIGVDDAFAGELRHRGEHSLELVATWLHHMRNGNPVEVVPILVGSFQHFVQNGSTPAHDPLVTQVLATLHTLSVGRRLLVVASGDMAHVGPAFSGAPLNQGARQRLRAADEELIDHMRAGDGEAFFGVIKRDRDHNNVCGVAPIYLSLAALGSVKGEQVGYATCPADAHDTSVVTVCGMVFT